MHKSPMSLANSRIDYKNLLRKYIKHILDSEGTDGLLMIWPDQAGDHSFSREEIAELRRLGGRDDLLKMQEERDAART